MIRKLTGFLVQVQPSALAYLQNHYIFSVFLKYQPPVIGSQANVKAAVVNSR
jgi:hypothetical protein